MEENAKQIAELLRVLANENRLIFLCTLVEGAKNVSRIAEKVPNISQSALSQHLSVLKLYGILGFEKKGQSVTYSIIDRRVEEVLNVLKQYYCQA